MARPSLIEGVQYLSNVINEFRKEAFQEERRGKLESSEACMQQAELLQVIHDAVLRDNPRIVQRLGRTQTPGLILPGSN